MAEARGGSSGGGDWPSSPSSDCYDPGPGPSYEDRSPEALTEPKRKRFRALRVVRKIFRRKAKNVFKDDDPEGPALKSRSTSELTVADDPEIKDTGSITSTAYSSGMSMSHDSIFVPETGSPEPPVKESRVAVGGAPGFSYPVGRQPPSFKGMQDELKMMMMGRKPLPLPDSDSDGDNDPGLPRSPCVSPMATEGKSAKFSSDSLASMGSSGTDNDEALGRSTTRTIFGRSASNDDPDLNVGATKLLSNRAALHKISVKPKRTHAVPRHRQLNQATIAGSLPTTPEDVEETFVISGDAAAAILKPLPQVPATAAQDKKIATSPTKKSASLLSKAGRPAEAPLTTTTHRSNSMITQSSSMTKTGDEHASPSMVVTPGGSSSKSKNANRKMQYESERYARQREADNDATASIKPLLSPVSPTNREPPKSLPQPTLPSERQEERSRSPSPEQNDGCLLPLLRKSRGGSGSKGAQPVSASDPKPVRKMSSFNFRWSGRKTSEDDKRKTSADDNAKTEPSSPPTAVSPPIIEPRPQPDVTHEVEPARRVAVTPTVVRSVTQTKSTVITTDISSIMTTTTSTTTSSSTYKNNQESTVTSPPPAAIPAQPVALRSNSTRRMANKIAHLSQNFENGAFSLAVGEPPSEDLAAAPATLVTAEQRDDGDSTQNSIMMILAQETGLPSVNPVTVTPDRHHTVSDRLWDRPSSVDTEQLPQRRQRSRTNQPSRYLSEPVLLPHHSPPPSPPGGESSSLTVIDLPMVSSKIDMPSVSRLSSYGDKRKPIEQQLSREDMDSLENEKVEVHENPLFRLQSLKDRPNWAPISSVTPPETTYSSPGSPVITGTLLTSNPMPSLQGYGAGIVPPVVKPAESGRSMPSSEDRKPPVMKSTFGETVTKHEPPTAKITFMVPPASLPPVGAPSKGVSPSSVLRLNVEGPHYPIRDKKPPPAPTTTTEKMIVIESSSGGGNAPIARAESLEESPAPPLPPKGETPLVTLRPARPSRSNVPSGEPSELENAFRRRSIKLVDTCDEASASAEESKLKLATSEMPKSDLVKQIETASVVTDIKKMTNKVDVVVVAKRPVSSTTLPAVEILEIVDSSKAITVSGNQKSLVGDQLGVVTDRKFTPHLIAHKTPETSATSSPTSPIREESKPEPIMTTTTGLLGLRKMSARLVSPPAATEVVDGKFQVNGAIVRSPDSTPSPTSPVRENFKPELNTGHHGLRRVSPRLASPPAATIEIVGPVIEIVEPVVQPPPPIEEQPGHKPSIVSGRVNNIEPALPRRSQIPAPVDRKSSPRKEVTAITTTTSAARKSICLDEANIVIFDSPDKAIVVEEKITRKESVQSSPPPPTSAPPSTNASTYSVSSSPASRKSSVVYPPPHLVASSKDDTYRESLMQGKNDGAPPSSSNSYSLRQLPESARPLSSIVFSVPVPEPAVASAEIATTKDKDVVATSAVSDSAKLKESVAKSAAVNNEPRKTSGQSLSRSQSRVSVCSIDSINYEGRTNIEVVDLPTSPPSISNGTSQDNGVLPSGGSAGKPTAVVAPPTVDDKGEPAWMRIAMMRREQRAQQTQQVPVVVAPPPPPTELIIDQLKSVSKRTSKVLDLARNFQKLQVS